MITQARLKELLYYSPSTGMFTWLETRGKGIKGNKAGHDGKLNPKSRSLYTVIRISNTAYLAHRLAWLYVYGTWPKEMDHVNGNGLDNRLCNLREVQHVCNQKNRRLNMNNKSGAHGVYHTNRANLKKRWWAAIGTGTPTYKFLGYFLTKAEAVAARKRAEHQQGFHSNHGRPAT